jgi:hypothetical protein
MEKFQPVNHNGKQKKNHGKLKEFPDMAEGIQSTEEHQGIINVYDESGCPALNNKRSYRKKAYQQDQEDQESVFFYKFHHGSGIFTVNFMNSGIKIKIFRSFYSDCPDA